MGFAMALEDLALGEVSLEEGAKTVGAMLSKMDDTLAAQLYAALRSWTWKTLEARRRDDELSGWMDIFSRASGRIEEHSRDLAIKLEAYMELLQASIMTAGAAARRNPLERKHVKSALRLIYRRGGRAQRKLLMHELRLKAPNLSRIMTPLLDDGLVMREIEGREVFYRLTMKGNDAVLPLVAHEVEMRARSKAQPKGRLLIHREAMMVDLVADKNQQGKPASWTFYGPGLSGIRVEPGLDEGDLFVDVDRQHLPPGFSHMLLAGHDS